MLLHRLIPKGRELEGCPRVPQAVLHTVDCPLELCLCCVTKWRYWRRICTFRGPHLRGPLPCGLRLRWRWLPSRKLLCVPRGPLLPRGRRESGKPAVGLVFVSTAQMSCRRPGAPPGSGCLTQERPCHQPGLSGHGRSVCHHRLCVQCCRPRRLRALALPVGQGAPCRRLLSSAFPRCSVL